MKLYGMDRELIEIYNIRNIESISLYDIVQNGSGKMVVVPALLITYDGGKTLNISARDKNFRAYVKKVVEVYNNEKDNLLEDGLTDPFRLRPHIKVDDKVKDILISGQLEQINEIYSFYDNKDSYDSSLLFQIDEIKSLLPIIKYHIKQFYAFTNRVVNFDDIELSGYRDTYSTTAHIDGIETFVTFRFNKVDNGEYEVYVGGLNAKNEPLGVNIVFGKDSIMVSLIIPSYGLVSGTTYQVTKGAPKMIHEITKNGIPVVYKNEDLPALEGNEYEHLADLDYDNTLRWYQLPWGALYGVEDKVIEISETEKIIDIHNMYIDVSSNSFMRKEYYSKTYRRNRTVSIDSVEMLLDEVRKNINGVCISQTDGIYAIETGFDGKNFGANGFYDGKLKSRYFYHIVQSDKGIKGITREGLKPVGRNENVLQASDLLNKANMFRLVKGE